MHDGITAATTSDVLGLNESTISPKRNTKDGRPKPVSIEVKYPSVIKILSVRSANDNKIFA